MATFAVLIDGKNTGRRVDSGNGVTQADLKRIQAEVYTGGDKKRVQLFRLI